MNKENVQIFLEKKTDLLSVFTMVNNILKIILSGEEKISILTSRDYRLYGLLPRLNIFIQKEFMDVDVRDIFRRLGITEDSIIREILIFSYRANLRNMKITPDEIAEKFKGRNKKFSDLTVGEKALIENNGSQIYHVRCFDCMTSFPFRKYDIIENKCPVCGEKLW